MSIKLLSLALAATACASPLDAMALSDSNNPCEPCQPQGATGTNPPAIGSDLGGLYQNVLDSVKGISFSARSVSIEAREVSGFCCPKSLNCVNVKNLNIPMCYDKFTTNFGFADRSFGSLTTGEYTSQGTTVNLLTGDISGPSPAGAGAGAGESSSNNIYANDPQAKPDTATLSIPPQYTGTGVGAAVPASELGSIIVYTMTIPGTTFTAPTTVPGTVRVNTIDGKTLSTTVAPTTITQATTVAPHTTVVTTQVPEETASSTAGAMGQGVDTTRSFGMSVVGAVVYALYAL